MSRYLCQGCDFNNLGWCKRHGIEELKSKRMNECESYREIFNEVDGGLDIMQKRICQSCLTRWYSSDSSSIWQCENCGHEILAPEIDEKEAEKLEEKTSIFLLAKYKVLKFLTKINLLKLIFNKIRK